MDWAVQFKRKGFQAEYINERARDWFFEGKPKPTPFDQIFIGSSQFYSEVRALNHTELIITDSPVHLASIYAGFYGGDKDVSDVLTNMASLLDRDYPSYNVVLPKPDFEYQKNGRWQSEDEADRVQESILHYLEHYKIPYSYGASIQDVIKIVEKNQRGLTA